MNAHPRSVSHSGGAQESNVLSYVQPSHYHRGFSPVAQSQGVGIVTRCPAELRFWRGWPQQQLIFNTHSNTLQTVIGHAHTEGQLAEVPALQLLATLG